MRLGERHTVKDYEALPEGSPYQLIMGELVMSPAPNPLHQEVLKRMFLEFHEAIERKKLGKVFFAPIDLYMDEENVFQPDMVVLLRGNIQKLTEKGIEGVPDLVVEVLSPSTAYYDLKEKKEVYERKGVKEYWIVDPKVEEVEVYVNEGGHFRLFSHARDEGRVRSHTVEGLEIDVKELFKEVL